MYICIHTYRERERKREGSSHPPPPPPSRPGPAGRAPPRGHPGAPATAYTCMYCISNMYCDIYCCFYFLLLL